MGRVTITPKLIKGLSSKKRKRKRKFRADAKRSYGAKPDTNAPLLRELLRPGL